MRKRFNLVPAALASGLVLATLTGCSATTINDACVPRLSEGAFIQNVAVLGEFGTEPIVSIPEGFTSNVAQSKIIDRAEDRSVIANEQSVMTVNYALIESENGEVFEASEGFDANKGTDFMPYNAENEISTFGLAFDCVAPGDRVLLSFTPEESAAIAGSVGLETGTNIVALIDVHDVKPIVSKAKTKNLPSGFPGVIFDKAGNPGVVIAPGKAPETTKIAALRDGDGKTVSSEDLIVANVLDVSWEGLELENTWATSGPTLLGSMSDGADQKRQALNGHAVGSTVVVLTPSEAGSATISVIEILAAG